MRRVSLLHKTAGRRLCWSSGDTVMPGSRFCVDKLDSYPTSKQCCKSFEDRILTLRFATVQKSGSFTLSPCFSADSWAQMPTAVQLALVGASGKAG